MDVELQKLIADITEDVSDTATQAMAVAQFDTEIGSMTAAATDHAICLLQYSDSDRLAVQLRHVCKSIEATPHFADNKHLADLQVQLSEWFSGTRREFTVPLNPVGTPFQTLVWEKLANIPFGATETFGEVAYSVERPGAIRAVAASIGANALAILVPCHRIVSAGGGIKGYSGGIDRKKWLIEFENNTKDSE